MKMEVPEKPKRSRGRPPKNRKCSISGCDRKHYAKGLCFNHWRKEKGYDTGGDRKTANAHYDQSEKGRARRQRVVQKRRTLKRITGIEGIQATFDNSAAVVKLRQALLEGDRDLAKIWTWLTPEQQDVIQKR